MMNIKPIRTHEDYRLALKRISPLIEQDPQAGTDDGDLLDVLATLIENYENKHYPIYPPDPIEAIRFRMEQEGLKASDMKAVFGTESRFYEVVNRKRNLTLAMIRKLHHQYGIPAESLLAE